MTRRLFTVIAAPVVGAAVALIAVWGVAAGRPGVSFEMDRDVPVATEGVYPAERDADATWVWTAPRAQVRLDRADRSRAWTCTVRVRAGRPPDEPRPTATLSIDGVARASAEVGDEFQDLRVEAPARGDRRGLVLGIDASETFRPPADPRELGVLVDRIACAPDAAVAPPAGVPGDAALAAALLGAGIALAGAPLLLAAGIASVAGGLQALPLLTHGAAYTAYPGVAPWVAFWTAAGLLCAAALARLVARAPLSSAALAVLAGSAGVLHLKLLALLHPAKPIVDALYHAHRLDRVLAGQFYFTQTMPNGVEFPYAVALYVVAAPWALLTADHVALLRVVTTAAEVAAGALLYVMAVRVRGDRVLGVFAVALYHAVPIAYPVIGNANLTNAFGQSAALAAVAAAVAWPPVAIGALVALTAALSVALLSHVSTLGLTGATVFVLAAGFWWRGGASGRAAARGVLAALVIASAASVGLYWGHFGETYRTLAAVRAEAPAPRVDPADTGQASPLETDARSLPDRVGTALRLGRVDLGWPLILLAIVGLAVAARTGPADRLAIAIASWGVAYVCFFAVGVLAPVSGSYERYAAEFIGRVDLAVYPAAVLLAAQAAARIWRAGAAGRGLAVAAVLWVALGAYAEWRAWIL